MCMKSLHIEITDDELIPENNGRWEILVSNGNAAVEPGGSGAIKISIRSLAPLFSRMNTAAELSRAGLIGTDDESQLRVADRIFAGPLPWLTDHF